MRVQFKNKIGKKKAGCGLCPSIRPILDLQFRVDYRVPFFATGAFVTVVDIGFVAGFATVELAGAAVTGAAVTGAEPVVVVAGSGSATGVTGDVGFGNGFAIIEAMYPSSPVSLSVRRL